MIRVASAIVAAAVVAACGAASAATITIETVPTQAGTLTVIAIEGDLVPGDDKRFVDIALTANSAAVVLNSMGGSMLAGIEIGKAIRLKHFGTYVPDDLVCASACALAWLGGVPRMMSERSQIGFHATSIDGAVSGAGNALVGAYLNQLGISSAAIAYMTEAPPDQLHWLTLADARRLNLEVERLDPQAEASKPAFPSSPPGVSFVDWWTRLTWIQTYSRENFNDAVRLAAEQSRVLSNTAVFRYDNNWYVVVAGPYTETAAIPWRAQLIAARTIPSDSLVRDGMRFADLVWGDPPHRPTDDLPEAPAVAPTGKKKPYRPNCRLNRRLPGC